MIRTTCLLAILLAALPTIKAFVLTCSPVVSKQPQSTTSLKARNNAIGHFLSSAAVMAAVMSLSIPVFADEYGKETEAPTLFTGETVMICVKRGPLGACSQTVERTPANDNDKSNSYFKDLATTKRQREDAAIMAQESEGNTLIQKLRQQSDENREKNELTVLQKTLTNDQSASFGPFDRQVVILNTDGRTFTLLENPQAMRLKKAGFIEDRKFVRQPTKEELADALVLPEEESGFTGLVKGLFAGG